MSELRIGVVGATGALGRQVVASLDASDLAVELVPFASRASRATSLDVSGEPERVRVPTLPDLAELDAVVLALPRDEAEALLPGLLDEGVPVLDPTGVLGDAPLFVPWANPWAVEDLREDGGVRLPGPLSLLLLAVCRPLQASFGLLSVRGTAWMPASIAGRAAIEELSGQVVSLFNQQDPPRAIFREGLAFDVLPSWGPVGPDGWSVYEANTATETASVLGLGDAAFAVTAMMAPLFAGLLASLTITLEQQPGAEALHELFADTPQLQHVDGRPLMPRARGGHGTVAVGRLREDPAGQALHLVASADPQALVGAACVDVLTYCREHGQL